MPTDDWDELLRQARRIQKQLPSDLAARLVAGARAAEARFGPTLAAARQLAESNAEGLRALAAALGASPSPAGPNRTGSTVISASAAQMITVSSTATAKVTRASTSDDLIRSLPSQDFRAILAILFVLMVAGALATIGLYLPPDVLTAVAGEVALLAAFLVELCKWIWRHYHPEG